MFTNYALSRAKTACKLVVLIPLTVALWTAPHRAHAQDVLSDMATVEQREAALHRLSPGCKGGDANAIGKQILGFFNTGGYFLTGNGKSSSVFGSPKFYNDATIYGRPKRIGGLELSGGAETLLLSDHFVPFTGGNEYDLLGASAMISTPHGAGKLRIYANAGLFYGRLRSVNMGFDRSAFVPSGSVGVEYPVNSTFSLEASYRLSQNIHNVNTDGFSVSLKIH